ncbi:MAG: hotdog fold thioesterase [Nocardioides sp.]
MTADVPASPDSPAPDLADLTPAQLAAQLPDGFGALVRRLEIEFLEMSRDRVVATMPVAGNTQPFGLLHGGASVALAESLGSIGGALHGYPTSAPVGVDINATHHRAVTSGLVTGVATPLHLGRRMTTWEIVITDEADRRVCTARITCAMVPIDQAGPGTT